MVDRGGNFDRLKVLKEFRRMVKFEEEVIELLVAKDYRALEELGDGEGLSASEIEQAVLACGRTLLKSPSGVPRQHTISKTAGGGICSAVCYLWTAEGRRPEVALTFSVIDSAGGRPRIRVDSITLAERN